MERLNKLIELYPPELKLVIVCCGSKRWRAEDLVGEVDWEVFLQWVKRHRVTPAVYLYLKENSKGVPEEVVRRIEKRYKEITKRNLLLAGEVIKICKLLRDNNIKAIPLKGVFLSKQLYNDFNFRETRDIDILIEKDGLNNAIEVLESIDYFDKKTVNYSSEKFRFINHHISLINSRYKINLELHWRLFRIANTGSGIETDFNNSIINSDFNNVDEFLPDINLHVRYVILHGMKHWWNSLNWFLDLKKIFMENPNIRGLNKIEEKVISQSRLLFELLFKDRNQELKCNNFPNSNVLHSIRAISKDDDRWSTSTKWRLRRFFLYLWVNDNKSHLIGWYIRYYYLKLFYGGRL
jgi:hypothetical protein